MSNVVHRFHKGAKLKRSPWTKVARQESFLRLANKRVPKALHTMKLLGNLGRYPHTAEHTDQIMAAVSTGVEELRVRLNGEFEKPSVFRLQ